MNFFRVHRLPHFQAPDTPAAAAPPADPALVAAADPAAGDTPAATDPPAPAADPVDPPAADPAADPKPHGNKGKTPWYLSRISEESLARQQAEDRAAAAEELAARLQRNPADPAAPPAPAAPRTDAEVEARAQQIVARQQIGSVISEGIAAFPDWDDRAAILGSAGAASPDFVMDVIGVDPKNAHKLLYALADDPAKAARLAKMDTRTRTIELVKMSMAANPQSAEPAKPAVPPKTVSKAPPPPPAIDPGSAQAVDWRSDKVSDADFSKGWEENAAKRAAKRR